MKKIVLTMALCLAMAAACNISSAKNRLDNGRRLYRTAGYKGSVSFTDQLGVWVGFDTSHGYMFSPHHYLGAGVGMFAAPMDEIPSFFHFFAEYKAYFLEKNSTPTAGIRAGYCSSLQNLAGNTFSSAFELDPNIGWDWAFNSRLGINLTLGAAVFMFGENGTSNVKAMPKITVGITF